VIDARPPHTETGLATRAVEGTAPKLPTGLDPASVAATICDAITRDVVVDLPSTAFQ
jgi:cyclic-di-GMP-binding biofilm dispersal mediator protein